MHTYFLPGIYHYLATHSEITVTTTTAEVAVVLLLIALLGREWAQTAWGRAASGGKAVARRFTIAVPPLLFVATVTVVERFRLLA